MTKSISNEISEREVISFLKANPGFFNAHSELLLNLSLTHESGAAVSLIEHQVEVLRQRNADLRRRLNAIMQSARTNDALLSKVCMLTLALLDVSTWHQLNEVLATHLLADFDADFVCCHLQQEHLRLDHLQGHAGPLPTADFTRRSQPSCTTLRISELSRIFPIQQHEGSGSAALLPLDLTSGAGCLAVGSRDPQHFPPDMDTLFIGHIANVLARIINRLD